MDSRTRIRRLVGISVFCAIAIVVGLLPGIKVSFLTLDIKDAVIVIAAMFFGPVSALFMSIAVPLLEMAFGSTTGFYGFIMNASATLVFSVAASWFYKKFHTLMGGVLGLLIGSVGMKAVMVGLNLWITPIYMGASVDTVLKMIPTLILPFNLLKALLNSSIVLILYKPVSMALSQAHMIPEGEKAPYSYFTKKTMAVLIGGILLMAVCLFALFFWMKGRFAG